MKLLLPIMFVLAMAATANAQQGATVWPLDYAYGETGPQHPMFDREGYVLRVQTKDYSGIAQYYEWQSISKLVAAFDFWVSGYEASATPDNQLDSMIIYEKHTKNGTFNWTAVGTFRVWWWEPIDD